MEKISTEQKVYAGFGIRLVALIIDGLIVGTVFGIVLGALGFMGAGLLVSSGSMDGMDASEDGLIAVIMGAYMLMIALTFIVQLLYGAFFESGAKGATLGKMAMGIKVTDTEGQRLSFGKALLRNVGKIISGMIMYIGYLIALFTDKKQALHDMMAGTLVVKK